MLDFVGTALFLRVAIWVAIETIHTFPSYYIYVKINLTHGGNLGVSVQ